MKTEKKHTTSSAGSSRPSADEHRMGGDGNSRHDLPAFWLTTRLPGYASSRAQARVSRISFIHATENLLAAQRLDGLIHFIRDRDRVRVWAAEPD